MNISGFHHECKSWNLCILLKWIWNLCRRNLLIIIWISRCVIIAVIMSVAIIE
jgi:hypothetical protein